MIPAPAVIDVASLDRSVATGENPPSRTARSRQGRIDGADVHAVDWDARGAASGLDFPRLKTPDFDATRKMVLLKRNARFPASGRRSARSVLRPSHLCPFGPAATC